MIKESITRRQVIKYLNSLVEADPVAMRALLCNRVPCNQELADHPTAQVRELEGGYVIGLMGVLAGLFGIGEDGMAAIAYQMREPDNEPENPRRLIGFCRTEGGDK